VDRLDVVDDFDTYEPEEPPEDFAPDVDETALEEEVAAREEQNGESQNKNIVTGDPNAGQKKPTSENDKKIPDEKRSTTPYMTKYERARVLGTRALQIRCVRFEGCIDSS
jgi:DNA-directed RNA polymerases I, II, and III subunit RPABC2